MGVYSIFIDEELVYTSMVTSSEYALTDIKCTLTLGEEGSAEFNVPPTNRRWAYLHRMKSRVQIFDDDDLVFSGRITEVNTDMQLVKEVHCEGDLALLLDSLHGPFKGSVTIRTFLQNALSSHNAQVDDWKQFALGEVTVDSADDTVSFDITGYGSTREVISNQITDTFGGYFKTRIGTVTETKPTGGEAFTIELKNGSRGTAVKTMQSRINGLNRSYSCGSADGIFGSNTRSGVVGFQNDTEIHPGVTLSATGIYDKETHNALMGVLYGYDTETKKVILLDYLADPYYSVEEESTSITYENVWNESTDKLKYGMRGEKVKTLQERMISLGPPYDNHGYIKPNGYFDAYLQWSVAKFQENNGLNRTLVYDKSTHDKLMEVLGIGEPDPEDPTTSDITPTNLQSIHFGVNLVEMSGEYPIDDIFTVLLPIGANNITIADVNDGSMYLENAAAVEEFGRIVKTFTWSKASSKEALKAYAEEYLKSHTMVFPDNLTVTAIDMHLLDDSNERIKLGDWINVVSEPHELDYILCVLEIELDLQNPGNTQYKLGYYIPSNFDSDTSEKSPTGTPNKNSSTSKKLSTSVAQSSGTTDIYDQIRIQLGVQDGTLGAWAYDSVANFLKK